MRASLGRLLYLLGLPALLLLLLFPARVWFAREGLRWLYILLFSSLLSFLLVRPIRAFAQRRGIVDRPDERKLHGGPTPLLGGLAVYLAFVVSLLANSILTPAVVGLLVAGTGVLVISLIDDIRPLTASVKLGAMILATGVVIASGISLRLFPIHTLWGQGLNVLLTVLWIVGLTNAMNFFDGMDGLAAGLAAIAAVFLCAIAYQSQQVFLGWVAAAVLGSTLGFLPHNLRPGKQATIFLGDAGSNFLGFTLAAVAVLGEWAENRLVNLAAPLLIFGVFIYDMVYITVDRVLAGRVSSVKEWVEYVGRDHLHHRLEILLGSQEHAVLLICSLSSALSAGALVILMASPASAFLLIVQAVAILLMVSVLERSGRGSA